MQLAPIPFDEAQRIDALHRLRILDTEHEKRFDRITLIAHYLFDVPHAFITLIDHHRAWFKSAYSCEMKEEQRDLSICGHAIYNDVTNDVSSRLFEVHDTEKDNRFSDNSFIIDTLGKRYYLGFVLQSADHRNIGTLSLADTRPRTLTATEIELFSELGLMAESELNNKQYDSQVGRKNFVSDANGKQSFSDEHTDKFLNLSVKLDSVQNQFNNSFNITGIKFNDWRVLNEIMQIEFATPYLISQKLGISPPLMSRRLHALKIKGLIEQWHSKDGNRRFVHLGSSQHGKKLWLKGTKEINRLSQFHLSDIICLK